MGLDGAGGVYRIRDGSLAWVGGAQQVRRAIGKVMGGMRIFGWKDGIDGVGCEVGCGGWAMEDVGRRVLSPRTPISAVWGMVGDGMERQMPTMPPLCWVGHGNGKQGCMGRDAIYILQILRTLHLSIAPLGSCRPPGSWLPPSWHQITTLRGLCTQRPFFQSWAYIHCSPKPSLIYEEEHTH